MVATSTVTSTSTSTLESIQAEIEYTQSIQCQCKKASRAYEALSALLVNLEKEKGDLINSLDLEKEQMDMDSVDIDIDVEKKENQSLNSLAQPMTSTSTTTTSNALPSMFIPIKTFGWDSGEYNSPSVSIYVTLPGITKDLASKVSCDFTANSFDLKIQDLEKKSYRLFKDNLEKNIIPENSKYRVKKDKIVITLRKVKGSYSYETWNNLQAKATSSVGGNKKGPGGSNASKDDPMGGIMNLMKDMYQDGDDNMKKIIGEAMMKAQSGEKSPGLGDLGGGLGGMPGMPGGMTEDMDL